LLYLEEAPLPGLTSPVGVRGRELGDVPLTGIVSLRVGVVVPDPLPAVRLLGVTRRWTGMRLGVPSSEHKSCEVCISHGNEYDVMSCWPVTGYQSTWRHIMEDSILHS
jgi:hypothetical protein